MPIIGNPRTATRVSSGTTKVLSFLDNKDFEAVFGAYDGSSKTRAAGADNDDVIRGVKLSNYLYEGILAEIRKETVQGMLMCSLYWRKRSETQWRG